VYDVVDNVRFYQPNAQRMRSAYTFHFLSVIILLGLDWVFPNPNSNPNPGPSLGYSHVY